MRRRDVLVKAPPAVWLLPGGPLTEGIPAEGVSDKDVIQMQEAEISALRSELAQMQAAANTITNTAAALAYLYHKDHPDTEWVTVPRDVRERMKNRVQLQVQNSPEGTQLRTLTRAPDHQISKEV